MIALEHTKTRVILKALCMLAYNYIPISIRIVVVEAVLCLLYAITHLIFCSSREGSFVGFILETAFRVGYF